MKLPWGQSFKESPDYLLASSLQKTAGALEAMKMSYLSV